MFFFTIYCFIAFLVFFGIFFIDLHLVYFQERDGATFLKRSEEFGKVRVTFDHDFFQCLGIAIIISIFWLPIIFLVTSLD